MDYEVSNTDTQQHITLEERIEVNRSRLCHRDRDKTRYDNQRLLQGWIKSFHVLCCYAQYNLLCL